MVSFLPGPIGKYMGNIGNCTEGAEGFWQDKFHAGKIWWFFQNNLEFFLVGIPSDDICPLKFIQGEIPPCGAK